MSGGGEGEGTTLEFTPTWVVAALCTVIVAISLAAERLLHYSGKVSHFTHTHTHNRAYMFLFYKQLCVCVYVAVETGHESKKKIKKQQVVGLMIEEIGKKVVLLKEQLFVVLEFWNPFCFLKKGLIFIEIWAPAKTTTFCRICVVFEEEESKAAL